MKVSLIIHDKVAFNTVNLYNNSVNSYTIGDPREMMPREKYSIEHEDPSETLLYIMRSFPTQEVTFKMATIIEHWFTRSNDTVTRVYETPKVW